MKTTDELSVMTAEAVKRRASAEGFDLCGIAPATDLPELAYLSTWLKNGYAGEMQYMHRSGERRADVRRVLPSARAVIVLGTVRTRPRTPTRVRRVLHGTPGAMIITTSSPDG